jgi:hypothetical protein
MFTVFTTPKMAGLWCRLVTARSLSTLYVYGHHVRHCQGAWKQLIANAVLSRDAHGYPDIRIYPDNLLSVVIRISHYPITDTNMADVAS